MQTSRLVWVPIVDGVHPCPSLKRGSNGANPANGKRARTVPSRYTSLGVAAHSSSQYIQDKGHPYIPIARCL